MKNVLLISCFFRSRIEMRLADLKQRRRTPVYAYMGEHFRCTVQTVQRRARELRKAEVERRAAQCGDELRQGNDSPIANSPDDNCPSR